MTLSYQIAVLPGDGIGNEVMEPAIELVRASVGDRRKLLFSMFPSGARHYQLSGEALPVETVDAVRRADATLLGAMGLPDVRYVDGREIVPQIDLREILDLFAGIRPVFAIPGVRQPVASEGERPTDFVLVRESTEGLFAERKRVNTESTDVAEDVMRVTRSGAERVCRHAFELGRIRKSQGHPGHVTCVDKANVLSSMVLFRQVFEEVAKDFPDLTHDCLYVDAVAMHLVQRPWKFDVMVTENMFGDILSDLGAGLMGGLGFAPSADINGTIAVFQPCHGTAPDIMGRGLANPTAMILSAVMMLEWLGNQHDDTDMSDAGKRLRQAVFDAYASGELVTVDQGGHSGTDSVRRAVLSCIQD